MKNQTKRYTTDSSSQDIYKSIRTEIKKGIFEKRKNLAGNWSDVNGYNINNAINFFSIKPNFGPFVQLNIVAEEVENGKTEVLLTRINGTTYKFLINFCIVINCLVLLVAIYIMIDDNINEGINLLIGPIVGVLQIFFFEGIAAFSIYSLKSRLIKLLKKDRIILRQ